MSKKLKDEYQNMTYAETPDLWDRISSGIDEGLYTEGNEQYLPKPEVQKKTVIKKITPYISVVAAAVVLIAVLGPMYFGNVSKSAPTNVAMMSLKATDAADMSNSGSMDDNASLETSMLADGIDDVTGNGDTDMNVQITMATNALVEGDGLPKENMSTEVEVIAVVTEVIAGDVMKDNVAGGKVIYTLEDAEHNLYEAVFSSKLLSENAELSYPERGKRYSFVLCEGENGYEIVRQPMLIELNVGQ